MNLVFDGLDMAIFYLIIEASSGNSLVLERILNDLNKLRDDLVDYCNSLGESQNRTA